MLVCQGVILWTDMHTMHLVAAGSSRGVARQALSGAAKGEERGELPARRHKQKLKATHALPSVFLISPSCTWFGLWVAFPIMMSACPAILSPIDGLGMVVVVVTVCAPWCPCWALAT